MRYTVMQRHYVSSGRSYPRRIPLVEVVAAFDDYKDAIMAAGEHADNLRGDEDSIWVEDRATQRGSVAEGEKP